MAPATIVVNLPAEARLTVNGEATQSTSETRVFRSPPLTPGSEYYYTLNAKIMRDGQPVAVTRRVSVAAGRETRVTLDFDRDAGGTAQPREVRPAAGEVDPQPNRDRPNPDAPKPSPNLERPKNNPNPQPQPSP
ncbi:MAG: TIGR03000 domain-containing protein [Gemmataceae bacterium]|nr:TIGR03000 domain-containing protein [Gemmataceae bacterium]